MTPPILKRFLFSWEQNKLLGIGIFLLFLGGSIVFALQPDPPRPKTFYRIRGQLAYSNPPPLFTSTGAELQAQGRLIPLDILFSTSVQQRFQETLELTNRQMKEILERKLKLSSPQPDTPQVVNLEYKNSPTPEEGVNRLAVLMNEMVEQSRLVNTSQLRNRIQALEQRLGTVQLELAAAEEAFYRFISTEGTSLLAV
ncbi:MAG: ATPase, partial [Xenococcaceae cyanobacterium MO_188.B19]|nr:ATPase [Xenococcaceae cyanobacterium MO_188.B19]